MQSVKVLLALAALSLVVGCGSSSGDAAAENSPAADVSKAGSASGSAAVEGKAGGRGAESTDPSVPVGR